MILLQILVVLALCLVTLILFGVVIAVGLDLYKEFKQLKWTIKS